MVLREIFQRVCDFSQGSSFLSFLAHRLTLSFSLLLQNLALLCFLFLSQQSISILSCLGSTPTLLCFHKDFRVLPDCAFVCFLACPLIFMSATRLPPSLQLLDGYLLTAARSPPTSLPLLPYSCNCFLIWSNPEIPPHCIICIFLSPAFFYSD